MRESGQNAEAIIAALDLQPHPEGGHYRETYRSPAASGAPNARGQRGAVTAIYYLLKAEEVSRWHRVDASEVWLWHAGAPLELSMAAQGEKPRVLTLGPAVIDGERPQGVVPEDVWQSARSLGAWTLVSCCVAPAFRFEGFEMAPPGWSP